MTAAQSSCLIRLDDLVRCGQPDRPAVTFRDETLTYAELADQVARAAAGLRGLGLRRGERVVVYLEKRLETVVAFLAVSAAGGVFVPVNPVFRPAQVGHVLADCAARVLITSPERHHAVLGELDRLSELRHVVLVGGQDEDTAPSWESLCTAEPLADGADSADGVIDVDVAAILYTSGSTGKPKGVVLSHRNMLAGAASVAGYLRHTSDDTVLSVLPLSFDAGFSQLSTALIAGAHVVLVNYLMPREVVRLVARHRVTALTCVPPLWLQLVAAKWPPEARAGLRYFANTGGHLPQHLLTRLRETFPNAAPYLMYGLTEAFRSTYLDPAEVDRRPGSIGKAIPNAEVLVVRPDGTVAAPGEHGEIVHRGALVALGYWNDPARTAQRFRPYPPGDGPVRAEPAVWSGDVAYRDEEGFLYFVGRTDDMIKTSGYRVSPTEVEEVAYATGLVAEAVAIGVPDERLGQEVVLVVTAPDGGETCDTGTLTKALAEELPAYMVPKRILVRDELPRSGNGKFDRGEVRRSVLG
ncbi:acyl-CoA ligase (AMP-forming), exosortase A system-associated [Labedaea rhizosphaerae]|uniref:Acyl-CoA ligase (AMP-forming) (Exosortase A-associated) n=1 Tax=Labedaea rhizosphaerae TaxID=598644 RepID=A0A4R6SFG6_LABRH|nr:acyl-CoA ligase (AMP-forming), exosortase A system-associated [Labedaea rhizosphaerae]TDQ00443.1 acyl-CoA ligase (AMP-forming) (exosortase A-associated) [Labedaea rhizosphaerae]